jgi:hypothetical protein
MTPQTKINSNPLSGFMRQPKIYIKLPSGGQYWAKGSLELSETEEYPVYSMTAKDEMMLKIPDALISGQALVDVIQHCMPNVKNAWAVPNLDLDVILIAIRVATYGEKMSIPLNIPDTDLTYEVDLRYVMASLIEQITWQESVQVTPELVVYVKPMDYRQVSASAVKTFETQRMLQIVNDSTMTDVEKSSSFKEAVDKLNDITVGLINNSVFRIDSSQGATDDLKFIKEFLDNADKEIFDTIKVHIEQLRNQNNIKPIVIEPTPDMIEKGVPNEPIEIPLVFDPSTFFA